MDADTKKLIELHKSGMAIQDIADEFGVALVTIKRRISKVRKEHNLPWRSKSMQKTRIDRAENDIDATAWNVRLGNQYIQREWRAC